MPETYYQSAHTGQQIDNAISRIASGEFDKLADDAVAAGASAQNAAVSAQQAKTSAESALTGIQTAIKNIPAGATPIVNDLTTGGVTMALSAEQGKVLRQIIAALTAADMGAVALDGSNAMTGNLLLEKAGGISTVLYDSTANSEGRVAIWDQTMAFLIRDNKGTAQLERSIHLKGYTDTNSIADALVLQNKYYGVTNDYPILHTGNKPSGSYTGNGSAAERTIDIGGIGDTVLICSDYRWCIVRSCALGVRGIYSGDVGVAAFAYDAAHVYNGKLVMKTADELLNANGKTYHYRVL